MAPKRQSRLPSPACKSTPLQPASQHISHSLSNCDRGQVCVGSRHLLHHRSIENQKPRGTNYPHHPFGRSRLHAAHRSIRPSASRPTPHRPAPPGSSAPRRRTRPARRRLGTLSLPQQPRRLPFRSPRHQLRPAKTTIADRTHGIWNADVLRRLGRRMSRPALSNRTRVPGSSLSRAARTEYADPPPTIT